MMHDPGLMVRLRALNESADRITADAPELETSI